MTPVNYTQKFETLKEKIMTNFGHTHNRLPLSKLINNLIREKWPEWVSASLKAGRLAPSAMNHQP